MTHLERIDLKDLRTMAKQEAKRQGVTFKEIITAALVVYLENQARQRSDHTFLLWHVGQV